MAHRDTQTAAVERYLLAHCGQHIASKPRMAQMIAEEQGIEVTPELVSAATQPYQPFYLESGAYRPMGEYREARTAALGVIVIATPTGYTIAPYVGA